MLNAWQNYEKESQQALDARRAGNWGEARVHFLEAAHYMLAAAKEAKDQSIRDGREAIVRKLLTNAKQCEAAEAENRPAPGVPSPSKSGGKSGGSSPNKRHNPAESQDEDEKKNADQWVVREKPDIRFDDVAGLESVKQDIRLKMIYPFEHPELADQFGVRAGGGILLFGPPGTGKTMIAKATAGEIDATFYTVSAGDLLSKWFGESEDNIKRLFEQAANDARAIIFIDEIESLAPARSDGSSGVMQRVVPQILQGMEGFGKKKTSSVLFLGATNVPWQLDSAVLRPGRFDKKVYIPLPDFEARRKLLEIYLSKRPIDEDMNFDRLARDLEGYSGADIKFICDQAGANRFLTSAAAGQVRPINTELFREIVGATPKSVQPESLKRFEEWAARSATG